MEIKTFKTLEKRVESLLKDYIDLKNIKKGFEEELEGRRLEYSELSKRIEQSEKERGLIKRKVENLLKKIEVLNKSIG